MIKCYKEPEWRVLRPCWSRVSYDGLAMLSECQMKDYQAVFYGELTSGKRKRGGQKLRYNVLKLHLKAADIDEETWERKAKNRPLWRKKIHDVGVTVERNKKEKYMEGWRKRHHSDPT